MQVQTFQITTILFSMRNPKDHCVLWGQNPAHPQTFTSELLPTALSQLLKSVNLPVDCASPPISTFSICREAPKPG